MHEWALAEGVISTAIELAEEEGAGGVAKINVRMGSLQQVDREIFDLALREIAEGTIAEGAEVNVEMEEAVLECRSCGKEWSFEESRGELTEEESESIHFIPDLAHAYIRCPSCGSPDFEIKKGRGVWIGSIELEEDTLGS